VTYDPRQHGARCDECPLSQDRTGDPVPPEAHATASFAIVGEAPGPQEVRYGRPFVGPSGIEEMRQLSEVGWKRTDAHWTNALLCRPPGNGDLKSYLMRLKARNRRRKRRGDEPWVAPVECCKPRLEKELEGFSKVLTLGGAGAKAVLGTRGGILDIRGGPALTESGCKVLPTLHPAFVLRAPRWKAALTLDHAKAQRFFEDRLTWRDPEVIYRPSIGELADFLGIERDARGWWAPPHRARTLAYDYETDSIDPIVCRVRCLGIGTLKRAIVVPFLSIDGRRRFYPVEEEREIEAVLRAWATGPGVKVGHNAGFYDTLVMEEHLGVTPAPQLDTILLHRLVEAELPHSLAYLGSTRTDVQAWKAGKEATTATDEMDLWLYNARDVAVTAAVAPGLLQEVTRRGLGALDGMGKAVGLLGMDHEIQRICRVMHRNGMRVDEAQRRMFLGDYGERSDRWRGRCVEMASEVRAVWRYESKTRHHPFNPGSGAQVARLLYEDWGLEPEEFTESGDPSVGDKALRKLLAAPLEKKVVRFIRALRQFRKAAKVVSTYLVPATPPEPGAEKGDRKDDYKGWFRTPGNDGRVHADWKAHTVVSGRLGSSPNMQNIPIKLRSMFIPQEGHLFVYADSDQLELRIAASRWGAPRYMEAFDEGQDPHQVTMNLVFGDAMWNWEGAPSLEHRYRKKWVGGKIKGHFDDMRGLAKSIQYASQYGATTETVHDLVTSAEDPRGELLYADLSVSEVRAMHEAWLEGCPEFPKGWDAEMAYFRRHNYVREEVTGRVRDCLDGDELNTIVNFPIQASGAGIINHATLAIDALFPMEYAGKYTGLVNQCHDALTLEVPIADAERCREALQAAMTGTSPALPGVEFKAEAAIKERWEE
jgi:uracil-DNA glycosylase family 4